MFRHSSRNAVATSLVAVIIIVLVFGMLGAFYFGQNSVKIIGGTIETTTTQTLQTIQTIQISQTILTTQTVVITQTDSSQTSSTSTGGNVQTMELISGLLNSGPATVAGAAGANFQLTFQNPGGATNATSIALSTGGAALAVTLYSCTSPTTCTAVPPSPDGYVLNAGKTTSFTAYFGTSPLLSGNTYSYVITFLNGQSISGALIAQ